MNINKMHRDKALYHIFNKAFDIVSDESKSYNKRTSEVFDMICGWNDNHPDETEIFGCEHYDSNDNWIGIVIEDDILLFPEETQSQAEAIAEAYARGEISEYEYFKHFADGDDDPAYYDRY